MLDIEIDMYSRVFVMKYSMLSNTGKISVKIVRGNINILIMGTSTIFINILIIFIS